MSMSRKDYCAIADALNTIAKQSDAKRDVIIDVVTELHPKLKADNPRFNLSTFVAAVFKGV